MPLTLSEPGLCLSNVSESLPQVKLSVKPRLKTIDDASYADFQQGEGLYF